MVLPVSGKHPLCGWGKFDVYSENKPYGIWVRCFQQPIRKLLRKPDETLDRWKTRISDALGSNISILVDDIPEMKLLFEDISPAGPLTPKVNQNCFEWVLWCFMRTFTSSRQPLVLFFDDIQLSSMRKMAPDSAGSFQTSVFTPL